MKGKNQTMNQSERRRFLRRLLIRSLLKETVEYKRIEIPKDEEAQRLLLRALRNIRLPRPIDDSFLKIQDEYLKEEIASKGITDIDSLVPVQPGLYLW